MPRLSAFFGTSALLGITLRRFPLPAAMAALFMVLQVLANHGVKPIDDAHFLDVQLALSIGFFWALSAHLAARARAWPTIAEGALALLGPLLTFAVLWGTPNDLPAPALLLGEAAILTTLAAASPGLRAQNNEALWRFTAVALEGAAIALVAAVILAGGLCILVFSITYLFELRDPARIIPDIWIVSLSLFWPLRAMSTLPRPEDPPETLTLQFNKALPFLLDGALVPIWIAYLAVLYAYAAKILIDGSLPRGNVAWMVHGFGALGVAVWLMVWPRRDSAPTLTRAFHRWFWATLPIPLLLLTIGVVERVGAYGWTEPRYMVAAGGVWLAAMALIYGLRPRRVPLALAPLSLAALCLLSTFGPWGAVSVSVRDQQARLESLLTRHRILVNGQIIPAATPEAIPSSDVQRIASAVEFLIAHYRFDLIKPWFDARITPSRPQIVEALGLRDVEPAGGRPRQRNIITIYGQPAWMRDRTPALVDMSGYDLVGQATFNGDEGRRTITSPAGSTFLLHLNHTTLQLRIEAPSGRAATIDLAPACAQLYEHAEHRALTAEQSRPAIITATGDLGARIAIQALTLDKAPAGFAIREVTFMIALVDRP